VDFFLSVFLCLFLTACQSAQQKSENLVLDRAAKLKALSTWAPTWCQVDARLTEPTRARYQEIFPGEVVPESLTYTWKARESTCDLTSTSRSLVKSAFESALAEWKPLPSPAEALEAAQLGHRLTRALDDLGAELRAVVLLVDIEGFTQREVAGMLEVPEGTVASRLFRARRQLRTALEAPVQDGLLRRYP
jgi:RNA polymerase sigma factor (sigma-70 family)